MTIANPGAVSTVVAAGKVASDWGNAIRDRVVNNFATAADRDAAIASPVVGQMACIDNAAGCTLALLQYVGATDGWRAPWNLPWGVIGVAAATSAQTGISAVTDLTGLTVTWTAVANRYYKATAQVVVEQMTGAGAPSIIIANGAGTQLNQNQTSEPAGSDFVGLQCITYLTGLSAGSQTIKVRCQTTANTVNTASAATLPAVLIIEDMGPNGAPA